jgi:hypothetical protein
MLGIHYLNGIGTPQDELKASDCWNLGGNPPVGQHMGCRFDIVFSRSLVC